VIGNVDAGKSTLVSVLTKGIEDDGNGSARVRVLNYQHEQETGRTSSIGHEIMGFDEKGKQNLP
jgi:GTPase